MPGTGIKSTTEDKVTEKYNLLFKQESQRKIMYFLIMFLVEISLEHLWEGI